MNTEGPLDFVKRELAESEAAALYRRLRRVDAVSGVQIRSQGRDLVSFGSNDYLGLAGHPALREAAQDAMEEWGFGSGGSRLVVGNLAIHEALEGRIAALKGTEAAIVFGSGYMANVGAIGALVGRGDVVLCDRLNHASLIDGCRMSGARLRTWRHRDVQSLEARLKESGGFRRRLVVTDSVFSVDGDLAPLAEMVRVAERYGASVMVDEAHSTGVFGDRGQGLAHQMGVADRIPVQMGTLSKAVGAIGGYVAGDRPLIEYLRNRSRSFIFTTALPPACCAAAEAGIGLIEQRPDLRERLWANVKRAREFLQELDCDTAESASQIIPIILGDAARAAAVSDRLAEAGFLVPALRPPTVPEGTSRLRLSLSAAHTPDQITALADALPEALSAM